MAGPKWVIAHSYEGWNMSFAGLLGGLPKLSIVCGDCGRHSKERAQESRDGVIFVWCSHCGAGNICQGLVVV